MEFNVLAEIAWWKTGLAIVFIIVCILLVFIVLLQKGRGGGLAGAFGGAGGQSAFGSKTGDVFTVVTICFAAVFLFLAVIMSLNYKADQYQEIQTQFSASDALIDTTSPEGNTAIVPNENGGEPSEGSPAGNESTPQPPADTPQSEPQKDN